MTGCCGQVIRGATGLAKSAIGLDRAPKEVIRFRRDVCRKCDHSEKRRVRGGPLGITSLSQCQVCSCFIVAKTKLASEKCPLGKWDRAAL